MRSSGVINEPDALAIFGRARVRQIERERERDLLAMMQKQLLLVWPRLASPFLC